MKTLTACLLLVMLAGCSDEISIRFSATKGGCIGMGRSNIEGSPTNVESSQLPDGRVQCVITSVYPVKKK